MTTFLDTSAPLPYCPGCGHPHVLRALDQALASSEIPPHRLALVTDIGCVGLADAYFPTLHTVHALHGRATALATGIRLGGPQATEPLKPIVLVGDGGATIGLLHLVHAAQLDVDVTVLVHNNLIYGMTGGQHSGLTPEGFCTTTTPLGNAVPPLDLERVLAGAGCTFFARVRAPSAELADTLVEALRHPGFAVVEALELCPTFAARVGGMTGKGLDAMADDGSLAMGIQRRPRPVAEPSPRPADRDPLAGGVEVHAPLGRLDGTVRLVVAGRAGERAQSAAKLVASAAAAAGLYATVRTDNPVTQGRGFSLAEVVVSSEPVNFTGLASPDLVLAVGEEGLTELRRRGMPEARRLLVDASLSREGLPTAEPVEARKRFGPKSAALGALVEAVAAEGWWAREAWDLAVEALPPALRDDTARVLAKAGLSPKAASPEALA